MYRTHSIYAVINDLKNIEVESTERTPKIPNEKFDLQVLDLIDRSLEEYISRHKPLNMFELAKIFQASLICYKKMTKKKKNPSNWKGNILRK